MKIHLFLIVTLLYSANGVSGSSIVSVGPVSDSDCEFNLIQDALDSGAIEIRISNEQQHNENLFIPANSNNITLRGDYTSCFNANGGFNSVAVKSVISGINATEPVVSIGTIASVRTIIIQNLTLKDGSGDGGFLPAGGISMPFSTDILRIFNSAIQSNSGNLGGGILISGDGVIKPRLFINNSDVLSNSHTSTDANSGGGGIYCDSASILIDTNSSVSSNQSEAHGGGVFADSCDVTIFAGNADGFIAPHGINNNQSKIHGGGIYAINGSKIQLGGGLNVPATVYNNLADSDNNFSGEGGGIFVTGASTQITLIGSLLEANRSGFHGGGIYLQSQASLITNRPSNCWDDYKCNYILDNRADNVNGNGGGIYLRTGATGQLSGIYFESNRADRGTAVYVNDVNTVANIKNSIFYKNGDNQSSGFTDDYVVMAINQARVTVAFSSFANNLSKTAVFMAQDNSTFNLLASIVEEPLIGPVLLTSGASNTITVNCVITHDVGLSGTNITIADPKFVDGINGDLHISSINNSPAIDACNVEGLVFNGTDIDGETRPYDDPNVVNVGGSYDSGADETLLSDVIFMNDFE